MAGMKRMAEMDMSDPDQVLEDYFQWLCECVNADGLDKSYYILLSTLFGCEFYWTVLHDDNRICDVLDMRREFVEECMYYYTEKLDRLPVSVFEVLVVLAKRMANLLWTNECGNSFSEYFWEMIENLGLEKCSDDNSLRGFTSAFYINGIVRDWMDRKFDKNGNGGIFPLRFAKNDQRKVEFAGQMHEYICQNYL